ncbi:uncharacterized protein [Temnothorax nylanderi]|uniref:uncharacterized protein n=1 Tax=Temnothorax nylanderi TaxID=102681 RepID=UPI003A851C2B
MEKETENLPVEEESQDALVDYDSDSSVVTVVERKSDSVKLMRRDREEKEKKEETERRGAIPKKKLPKVIENVDVTKAWAENRPILPIGSRMIYEKQEKLVAKMDNSMQMLDKIMTKATEMMENMVEVSRINLEKEKVKLRRLEVNNKNTQKLRNVDLIRRQSNLKEMTADEIKCYRCNKMGHMAKDCPLAELGAWFCYYCQEVRGHKGDSCPNAGAQANRFRGKRYLNKTVNNNIKKKGRFVQKGTKRVDNKGKITKIQPAKKPIPTKTAKEGKSEEGKLRMVKLIEDRESPKELVNFIVDSDATDHIVNKNIILSNFEKCNNRVIKCANKNELADISIDGKGDLLLLTNEKEKKVIKLTNVIATKEVSENLLSLRKLADARFSIYLDDKLFKVYNKLTNKIVFEGIYEKPNWIIQFEVKNNNIEDNDNVECAVYRCRAEIVPHCELPEQSQANIQTNELSISERELDERDNVGSAIGRENEGELANVNENIEHNNTELEQVIKLEDIQTIENIEEMCESSVIEKVKKLEKINEAMLWHVRLGHASLNYLRQLQKVEKRLENVKFDNSILECEVCIMAKMAKLPFKENRNRAQRPLQVIHTDIMGPIKPTSYPGQKRFIITFIDDYSRLAKAYSLKTKDESGKALEKYLISARNLLGKEEKLCYVKSDQGKEFTGGAFKEVLKREKIKAIFAPPYTPEHNGVAERFNRTLQEKVRTYMFDSGLPKSMWELAVDAAVHAYNRSPHKTIEYEIPLKKFSPETSCHFEKIKRFGCIGYARVPKPTSKYDKRAIRGVLVGYTDTGYILWHPSTRKFIESRHIRFNEKVTYKDVYKNSQIEDDKDLNKNWMKEFVEDEEKGEQKLEIPEKRKRGRPRKQTKQLDEPKQKAERKESETPMTRSKTKRKLEDNGDTNVRRLIEDISCAAALNWRFRAGTEFFGSAD